MMAHCRVTADIKHGIGLLEVLSEAHWLLLLLVIISGSPVGLEQEFGPHLWHAVVQVGPLLNSQYIICQVVVACGDNAPLEPNEHLSCNLTSASGITANLILLSGDERCSEV